MEDYRNPGEKRYGENNFPKGEVLCENFDIEGNCVDINLSSSQSLSSINEGEYNFLIENFFFLMKVFEVF